MPMPIPDIDPRALKAVMDAMLAQQGAIPQGAPYVNPNWAANLPNEKFSPYVLGNEGVMKPSSGGALVPQAPRGALVPPIPPGLAGLDVPAAAPGTALATIPGEVVKDLGGASAKAAAGAATAPEAGMAKAAAETAAKVARSPLTLGRVLHGLGTVAKVGRNVGIPLALVAAPARADAGNASTDYQQLRTTDDDNMFEAAFKAWLRGNENIGEYALDTVTGPFLSKRDRDARREWKESTVAARKNLESANTQEAPKTEQERMLQEWTKLSPEEQAAFAPAPVADIAGSAPQTVGAPQPAMDSWQQLMLANMPKVQEVPDELRERKRDAAIFAALDFGNNSPGSAIMRALSGMEKSRADEITGGLAAQQDQQKAMQEWLLNNSKVNLNFQKAQKDNVKIHSGSGGFLVETRNADGTVSLKPMMMSGGKNKAKTKAIAIGKAKFDVDNPFANELSTLRNLEQVGVLDQLLQSDPDTTEAVREGLSEMDRLDPEKVRQAQVITFAKAMRSSPEFAATVNNLYQQTIGTSALGAPNGN